jgi:hypothetical protein
MKNTVILGLAALSLAAGIINTSATAEERNESSRSGDDLSRLRGPAGAVPSTGGLPLYAHPKAEALERRAMRSDDENGLVAGDSAATPVIPAASLVGSDAQQMLSPGGQQTGSGFAPIKAALAGRRETGDLLTRSADPASLLYLYAPPK